MIVPKGNRVFLEAVVQPKDIISAGGILVPGWEAAPESIQGKVLAVGPEVKDFKKGDIVLVAQFAPTAAKEKPTDKTFIVPAEDIMGVIVPDKAK